MKKLVATLLIALAACSPSQAPNPDAARWAQEAQNVTIIRDDWGIAHVYGKTDADAVFGAMYAQAEDDFNRVETNYLNSMGRLAEAEGEGRIYQDLRMKLFIDPDSMKALYGQSPEWLQALMNSFADGLNYYLYKHPEVKPRVITHFEPWMALTFSEGSIGGDIERVNLRQLEAFYGGPTPQQVSVVEPTTPPEPTGSNGIAIAPANTADHHALLYINPHTSFFFRSELQMVSDSGLNAYGASTWGQFFIYQGFNDHIGWMHTSSGVDNIDEYAETVQKKEDGSWTYKYGKEERPIVSQQITVPYKTDTGMASKVFTVYRTQHGPIVRDADGKWIAIRLMQEPMHALKQSYMRTKATDLKSYLQSMELHTNSSNNTILADKDGDIAYFHSNFIPKRDPKFDWTRPVDGSNPATDWNGVLSVDETPKAVNPASGWVYNSNNWPWSAAGPDSPKRTDFPAYVETGSTESPRGLHALRVLPGRKDFTMESLVAAGFDSYLPSFGIMIPSLIKAYDAAPASNPLKAKLKEQIDSLRNWDYRWGVASVPTSLAVFWGEAVGNAGRGGRAGAAGGRAGRGGRAGAAGRGGAGGRATRPPGMSQDEYVAQLVPGEQLLQALADATDKLTADFGSWKTPWGDINRLQRLNDDITPQFNDSGPSIPVGFTSSRWGSLASFGARAYPNTKKWYGTSGNSFLAVVEFGDSVKAKAVSVGGESGDPKSKHFNDQSQRYADGNFRDVYYYRPQLAGHTEREYHPGG